jgi:hypothetical protein
MTWDQYPLRHGLTRPTSMDTVSCRTLQGGVLPADADPEGLAVPMRTAQSGRNRPASCRETLWRPERGAPGAASIPSVTTTTSAADDRAHVKGPPPRRTSRPNWSIRSTRGVRRIMSRRPLPCELPRTQGCPALELSCCMTRVRDEQTSAADLRRTVFLAMRSMLTARRR